MTLYRSSFNAMLYTHIAYIFIMINEYNKDTSNTNISCYTNDLRLKVKENLYLILPVTLTNDQKFSRKLKIELDTFPYQLQKPSV